MTPLPSHRVMRNSVEAILYALFMLPSLPDDIEQRVENGWALAVARAHPVFPC